MKTKRCPMCGIVKTHSEYNFNRSGKRVGTPLDYCKKCCRIRIREWNHRSGRQRPMNEAKDSSSFLGVHVAERVINGIFENAKHMPYGFRGYDFTCGNGYKIDVKSSCLHYRPNRAPEWGFGIDQNHIADYFLCIGFDDREQLNPMHVWLIPGHLINNHNELTITNSHRVVHKWCEFEKCVDKAVDLCEKLRHNRN